MIEFLTLFFDLLRIFEIMLPEVTAD